MKISKTAVLVLWWIFATLGLWLMVVNAAEKTLTMDLKNAVQHFKTVRLITTSDNSGVELNRIDGPLVEISGANNFIITTWGTEESQINQILNVRNSSILWWKGNKINNGWSSRHYNVILWWEWNLMDWSVYNFYNVILWWKGNQIHESRQSVILWWEWNIINNNSSYDTVIWNKNTLGGSYSVAVWYKNTLSSSYSAAVWSNWAVGGTRSFLWTNDTLSVGEGDVFVVNWENGMVVNANKAHSFAKLTVWWSLVIGTKDISAWEGWMIKVLNGTNWRKCFCSHNGSGRNSLHGGWSCAPICNGTQKNPKCAATADVTCNWKVFNVENGCEIWSVVAGTGAFFIDNGNYIHWACESENGNVTTSLNPSVDCKQKIPADGQCGSSKPEAGCGGERDTCTKWDLYTEITKPDDENYWYWYCKYGAESIKECKAAKSKQSKSCSWKPANSYWVNDKFTQILDGGAWKPLNKTPTHSSDPSVECSFMCNEEWVKYKWDGSNCVLITFSCKNTKPTQNGWYIFTTKNPWSSSEEKNWTHITDGTAQSSLKACEFTCDKANGYTWNGSICYNSTTFSCKNTKPTQNGWYIFTTKNPWRSSEEKNLTHITDGTAQSSLKAWEFTCDKANGYKWNGTICVSPTSSYTCAKTLANKYKCQSSDWTYVNWTTPSHANNEYMWFCNNWATKCGICDDGTKAEPPHSGACSESTFSCQWTTPPDPNSHFYTWSDQNLKESKTWAVYSYKDAQNWAKCAYVCNDWYAAYDGKCYPCSKWTWSKTNPDWCELDVTCPTNYRWNNTQWKCLYEWSCKLSDGTVNNRVPSNALQKWEDVMPIWNADWYLKCYDARNWKSITKNSCEFQCPAGTYCTNLIYAVDCRKPYCYKYNFLRNDSESIVVTWWKLTINNPKLDAYLKTDWTFVDVDTKQQFNQYVANNSDCCWYWCPEKNRWNWCKNNLSTSCLSEEEIEKKKSECAAECIAWDYAFWYDEQTEWSPTVDTKRKFYYSRSDYLKAKAAWTPCIKTCEEWANINVWWYVSQTLGQWWYNTAENAWDCRKTCPVWQIYTAISNCHDCPAGMIPEIDKSKWHYWQPITCIEYSCPTGYSLDKTTYKSCVSSVVDGSCSEWGVYIKSLKKCVICLDKTKTPDPTTWECK